MKFIAIVTRTLKQGKTYEDYRKAWYHTTGFGVPTTMYTMVNVTNPREITSIGIMDAELEELYQSLEIDIKDRLANPMDDVIESSIIRKFGVVTSVDDFSPEGELTYIDPQIDGKPVNFDEIPGVLNKIAEGINYASKKRDELKGATNKE